MFGVPAHAHAHAASVGPQHIAVSAADLAAAGGAAGYAQPVGLYAIQQGVGGFTLADAWGHAAQAVGGGPGGGAGGGDPYAAFAGPAYAAAAANQAAMAAAAAAAAGTPGQAYLLSPQPGPAAAAAMAAALGASPTAASLGMQDDVRTIFISGFPPDVRDRELHNMLRYIPGYEACQMNWKAGQPQQARTQTCAQGFALFSSPAAARFAVDLISGAPFEEGAALRAEMARKNMYLKADDPSVKRASRPSPLMPPGLLPVTATLPPMSPTAGAVGALYASPLGSPAGMLPLHIAAPLRPAVFSPVTNLRDNPPCNTLFIGNLGDNVIEGELRALMTGQPGYRQMKLVKGPRSTTAFVEFSDVASAMLVHQTLQGAVLQSSDRGGIRIQYSKNPFGRREDAASDPGVMAPGALPNVAAQAAHAHVAAVAAAAAAHAAATAAAAAPQGAVATGPGGGLPAAGAAMAQPVSQLVPAAAATAPLPPPQPPPPAPLPAWPPSAAAAPAAQPLAQAVEYATAAPAAQPPLAHAVEYPTATRLAAGNGGAGAGAVAGAAALPEQ